MLRELAELTMLEEQDPQSIRVCAYESAAQASSAMGTYGWQRRVALGTREHPNSTLSREILGARHLLGLRGTMNRRFAGLSIRGSAQQT
jgi:hypothetical protein